MKSELICIRGLFEHNLSIPDYQRPYRWKVENAQILFDDLYASFKKNKEGEYRIGSIVLYYDNNEYWKEIIQSEIGYLKDIADIKHIVTTELSELK